MRKRITPDGWEPGETPSYPVFLYHEARFDGWWKFLRTHLPAILRDERGWVFIGPRWKTRSCIAYEWWSLFEILRDDELGFSISGPKKV